MREWIESQVAAGLPALRGSSVSGTLAVQQELINELLGQWLSAASDTPAPAVDLERLKSFVKAAAVRAEPGIVKVDFTIAI